MGIEGFPSAPPWLPITRIIMGTDNTPRFRRVFLFLFSSVSLNMSYLNFTVNSFSLVQPNYAKPKKLM